MKTSLVLGMLLATASAASNAAPAGPTRAQVDQEHAFNLIVHASYYSPFGEFYIELNQFVRGLLQSQTKDSTDPIDINGLPIVSHYDDNTDAFDFALGDP
jgi:hypothetical protein